MIFPAYRQIEDMSMNRKSVCLDVETICDTGRTRYILPPMYQAEHSLNNEFVNAMCQLPLVYDRDSYLQFLDIWGTV